MESILSTDPWYRDLMVGKMYFIVSAYRSQVKKVRYINIILYEHSNNSCHLLGEPKFLGPSSTLFFLSHPTLNHSASSVASIIKIYP